MSCSITFGLTVPLRDWNALQTYAGHGFEHLQLLKPATLTLALREKDVLWSPNPANHNIFIELLKILEYLPSQLARCHNHLSDIEDCMEAETCKMSSTSGAYVLDNVLCLWRQAVAALRARECQTTSDVAWSRLTNLRDDFTYYFTYKKQLTGIIMSQASFEGALEKVEDHLVQLKSILNNKIRHHFYNECSEFLFKADHLRWILHLCCRFVHPILTGAWLPITKQKENQRYGQLLDDYFEFVDTETNNLRNLFDLYQDHINEIWKKTGRELEKAQSRQTTPFLLNANISDVDEVNDDDDDNSSISSRTSGNEDPKETRKDPETESVKRPHTPVEDPKRAPKRKHLSN